MNVLKKKLPYTISLQLFQFEIIDIRPNLILSVITNFFILNNLIKMKLSLTIVQKFKVTKYFRGTIGNQAILFLSYNP